MCVLGVRVYVGVRVCGDMSSSGKRGDGGEKAGGGAGAASAATKTRKRKAPSSEEELAGAFDLSGASNLGEVYVPEFDLSTVDDLPVIFIHAPPREGGLTTLIASLLIQAQDYLDVNAAVVLCDRPGDNYMNHILPLGPQGTVLNQPPDRVLEELIRIQSDSSTLDLGSAKRRIVLALDDVIYTPKLLGSESFIRNIKRAKQYDIMVIIGTTTPTILPRIASTFVTHAFATKCYAGDDIKLLHKCLFGRFDKPDDLEDILKLCSPHEFVVNVIKPTNSVCDITSRYTATVYRKTALPRASVSRKKGGSSIVARASVRSSDTADEEDVDGTADDDVCVREFDMDPKLAGYLSGTLAKLSSGR